MGRFARILGGLTVVAGLFVSVHALADSNGATIFARLEALQAERDHARAAAEEYHTLVSSLDQEIVARKRRAEVAHRAAGPVHRRMASTLNGWSRAMRAIHRGQASDTRDDARQLLLAASREAIAPALEDVDVLTRAEGEERALSREVARRVEMTVVFAQNKATAETRSVENQRLVEDAGQDPEVDRDLQRTDESLHRSLSHLLKHETQRDFHRLKGTLMRPVAGAPEAKFGPRAHGETKVSTRHTGYTWKIAEGTPVKAAAGGLVVYAHRFEGYGNLVIIDHGGGYHTLYAHLKAIDVEMGEKVIRGRLIAKTGDTGSLEGPKFYFELRKDGQAIDPTEWFLQHD